MKWEKRGLIFTSTGDYSWMRSHAQIPVTDLLDGGVLRIYFGTRDSDNRTSTGFIEVDAEEPSKILRVADRPCLVPGKLGTFDDCGAMPSSIVTIGKQKLLYYIGWNRGGTVRYHNSIGLAISKDGGETFEKLFEGPIMDRTHLEPYFVVTPYVIIEGGLWRMWYCGCTGWTVEKGLTEPRYQIRYAESADGVNWRRGNTVCIPFVTDDEANTRPCVARVGTTYRMWYSFRSTRNYRTDSAQSYRLGQAESADGVSWRRTDEQVNLLRSSDGWDSEMIAYPYVYMYGNRWYLLYNGNGFGKTGFGYAVSEGLTP